MRISDWSSDVCSSDLLYLRDQGVRTGQPERRIPRQAQIGRMFGTPLIEPHDRRTQDAAGRVETDDRRALRGERDRGDVLRFDFPATPQRLAAIDDCTRSEEHTSELQSLMRISYAVFCLKK